MTTTELRPSECAICGTSGGADELYPATFSVDDLTAVTFSARRLPDRVHLRVVRCRRCRLVRSDPAIDPELLTGLYEASAFAYEPEIPDLVRTYGRWLRRLRRKRPEARSLREVGCGNGFMLAEALRSGFTSVSGLEPSREAIEQADPNVRTFLICDVLRPGLIEPQSVDAICLFQVFDHLPDPREALDLCRDAVKPGGSILMFNHNVRALSARVLRGRSPIVDIEHTYLYDPATLAALCTSNGLIVEHAAATFNWCSLRYLIHLLPLAPAPKAWAMRMLGRSPLGLLSLPLPLGNLSLIATRPTPPSFS